MAVQFASTAQARYRRLRGFPAAGNAARPNQSMAKRDNHYEAAFEAYLRSRRIPYVAIDEAKRSLYSGESLKSLDFIVHTRSRPWLVDVKGRRFPSGEEQKQYWKNWSTQDDLRAMAAWERLFGASYRGLFVFAYAIAGDRSPLAADQLFAFRNRLYAFLGVSLCDYACYARPISTAWRTLALRSRQFREVARPIDELFDGEGGPNQSERSGFAVTAAAATIEADTSRSCSPTRGPL